MDIQKLEAAHKVLERFQDYMQGEARVFAVLGHGAYAIENKLVEIAPKFKPLLKDLQKITPIQFAHSLVGTWGAFEAMVDDFIFNLHLAMPQIFCSEELERVQIKLNLEQLNLDQERLFGLFLRQVKQDIGSSKKLGIEQFESLFKLFNLSGVVDAQVKKDFMEMQQIRHVIVHRASIVDEKLERLCPWLEWKLGEKIELKEEHSSRYSMSFATYGKTMIDRSLARLKDAFPE
jgi:hypothetical protein